MHLSILNFFFKILKIALVRIASAAGWHQGRFSPQKCLVVLKLKWRDKFSVREFFFQTHVLSEIVLFKMLLPFCSDYINAQATFGKHSSDFFLHSVFFVVVKVFSSKKTQSVCQMRQTTRIFIFFCFYSLLHCLGSLYTVAPSFVYKKQLC